MIILDFWKMPDDRRLSVSDGGDHGAGNYWGVNGVMTAVGCMVAEALQVGSCDLTCYNVYSAL